MNNNDIDNAAKYAYENITLPVEEIGWDTYKELFIDKMVEYFNSTNENNE